MAISGLLIPPHHGHQPIDGCGMASLNLHISLDLCTKSELLHTIMHRHTHRLPLVTQGQI